MGLGRDYGFDSYVIDLGPELLNGYIGVLLHVYHMLKHSSCTSFMARFVVIGVFIGFKLI